eukprot:1380823-Rhodomonas_salina.1
MAARNRGSWTSSQVLGPSQTGAENNPRSFRPANDLNQQPALDMAPRQASGGPGWGGNCKIIKFPPRLRRLRGSLESPCFRVRPPPSPGGAPSRSPGLKLTRSLEPHCHGSLSTVLLCHGAIITDESRFEPEGRGLVTRPRPGPRARPGGRGSGSLALQAASHGASVTRTLSLTRLPLSLPGRTPFPRPQLMGCV